MKKVLIVEDDAIIDNIYQRKLQMDGFQVQHAADGEIAMEMIKCSAPDIVLLDLQLPKANGIEVLERQAERIHDVVAARTRRALPVGSQPFAH